MPTFDQYQESERRFQERYGDWLQEYPYLALLAESKLREEFDLSEGRRQHIKHKKPLTQYLPTYRRWKHTVYRRALSLLYEHKASNATNTPGIFFTWHQEKRKSITGELDRCTYFINRGMASGLQQLCSDSIRLQSLVGVSPKIWRSYRNIYNCLERSLDIENAVPGQQKMENIVQDEVRRAARIFAKTGVRYMIIGSDQSAYNRLKCEAARQAGIKTAVIGHGYFRSRHLGGVLPVYADRLFVWTPLQQDEIHQVMSPYERNRVVCEGFPYPVNQAINTGNGILLALDDIPTHNPGEWWTIYDRLIAGLVTAGYEVIVRPRRNYQIDLFSSRNDSSNVRVSRDELYDDFDQVSKVICGSSSLAVQAAYFGLQVVRVAEWTTERHVGERIQRVPLNSILEAGSTQPWHESSLHPEATQLTLNKIIKNLDEA